VRLWQRRCPRQKGRIAVWTPARAGFSLKGMDASNQNVWFHAVAKRLEQTPWLYANPLMAHGMGDSSIKLLL